VRDKQLKDYATRNFSLWENSVHTARLEGVTHSRKACQNIWTDQSYEAYSRLVHCLECMLHQLKYDCVCEERKNEQEGIQSADVMASGYNKNMTKGPIMIMEHYAQLTNVFVKR
jgi:hypothetical protein